MKISVIGCGYLGAVHAAAMASLGHEVIGIDIDPARVRLLSEGRAPFFEPGLDELLRHGVQAGMLRFSTSVEAVTGAAVHFLAVGTPASEQSGAADVSHVWTALRRLLPHLQPGDVVVGKSTVPVGTAAELSAVADEAGACLVWNPEFLREGWAVRDTLSPDRIVIGTSDPSIPSAGVAVLREVYASALAAGVPCLVTDFPTAELVKMAANAFLATKISFINAMAEIAEVAGGDVTQLAEALGHDVRIGHRFLGAGIGFGGGCLPKDIRAFSARAAELGRASSLAFLDQVDAINLRRRARAVELVADALDGVQGRLVTVLGAAFKPHSDDVRDSPGLEVAARLHEVGAKVTVTDPAAIDNARRLHPQLRYVQDLDDAVRGAEALVLVTEWDEYRRGLSPQRVIDLTHGRVVVDGRNALDPASWRARGFDYRGMGRP